MGKLLAQIVKFGIVGAISFVVDFAVYGVLCNGIGVHYIVSGAAGFFVSVVVNYLLSMRFVFVSKEDMRKDKEFFLFVILSLIGMILNSVILYVCIDGIYMHWHWLKRCLDLEIMNLAAKIIATGIVMIYNFVTRKLFLEKRADE